MLTHIMVVGTTKPQDFQILSEGESFDATGFEIAIEFRPADAGAYPGFADDLTVDWLAEATSQVRVTGVEAMSVGDHRFRWKITDEGGQIEYVPNLEVPPNTWKVVRV